MADRSAKLKIGLRVLTLAFVVTSVAIALFGTSGEQRATAGLIVSDLPSAELSLDSDAMLPRMATNKAWYGIWLMFVGKGNPEPFVQVGLCRLEDSKQTGIKGFPLSAFVAFRRHGQELTYFTVPIPNQNKHPYHLQILSKGRSLILSVQGKAVHTERLDDILYDGQTPKLDLMSELFAYGDRAIGTLSNISIRGLHNEALIGHRSFLIDRGVCLVAAPGGYEAVGTFKEKAVPSATKPPLRESCAY